MARDPYQVLGVPRDADEAQIKDAYRTLAKRYHPDLHPDDPNAARRMNEINEAYDQIKNPQAQRDATDQTRRTQQPYGGYSYGGYGYGDPARGGSAQGDPWEEIFRNAQGQRTEGPDPWEEIFKNAQRQRTQSAGVRSRFFRIVRIALILYLLLSFGSCALSRLYYYPVYSYSMPGASTGEN